MTKEEAMAMLDAAAGDDGAAQIRGIGHRYLVIDWTYSVKEPKGKAGHGKFSMYFMEGEFSAVRYVLDQGNGNFIEIERRIE